jgi:hypothetical protein
MIIDKELHDITQDHEKQKLPLKIRLNNQQEFFFFFFLKKKKKKISPPQKSRKHTRCIHQNTCFQAMNIPNYLKENLKYI